MKLSSADGLTRLIVDSDETPAQKQVIQDPHIMDQHLLEYCKQHFGQAYGTPSTVPPLYAARV